MKRLSDWLNSCSFEDPYFGEADRFIEKHIDPYFQLELNKVEEVITSTIKLYKEVIFLKDTLLGDQKNLNIISRKEIVINIMTAWIKKHEQFDSIIKAVCYDLAL